MKIKALRTFRGDAGNVRRDAEATVTDIVGRSLIRRRLAVEVVEERAEKPAPPRAKGANRPKAKASAKPKAKAAE